MYTLYRDDDISVTSNIDLLMRVHDLFLKHNKTHTVAVLMKDIWENKEVWYWLMTAKNLEIGLHGWEHIDYSIPPRASCSMYIKTCIDYWNKNVLRGKYARQLKNVFYPPWNHSSDDLWKACEEHGMVVDTRVGGEVFNFHYWSCQDKQHMDALEEALKQ